MMLASRSRLTAAVVFLAVTAMVGRAQGGSISVSSAMVNQPGDPAQVCVTLTSGGEEIAGTQNDLVWDGTCATLSSPQNCKEVGGHGKPLAADFPGNGGDFTVRGIILSFNNVDPLPDGPLWCCTFTVEASPGQCCPISVQMALGSSPKGDKSIPLAGNQGKLCTQSDQSGRGGGFTGGPAMNQPLSASNAPVDSGMNAPQPAANQPRSSSGQGAGAPPAQVLQGGGAAPGQVAQGGGPPANVAASGAPAEIPPTIAMFGAPTQPAAAAAPTPPRPALPPPTIAATVGATPHAAVPTAPVAAVRTSVSAGTPTHPRLAVPTHGPTRQAGANAGQVAPVAAEKSGGWFGCQVASGATALPALGLGAIAALAVVLRRGRGGR